MEERGRESMICMVYRGALWSAIFLKRVSSQFYFVKLVRDENFVFLVDWENTRTWYTERLLEALVASWSHVILRYGNTATPSGWRFLAPSELGTDWQSGQVKPREVTRQQCRCGRARGGIESERIGQRGIKGGGDRGHVEGCFHFEIFLLAIVFFFPFFSSFLLSFLKAWKEEEKVWKTLDERLIFFFPLFLSLFEKRKIFRIRLFLNFFHDDSK